MEIFTLVTGVIYIILEIRQKNFMWVIGVLTSVAAMWVFWRQSLYASFGLNTYYLITAFIGLWQWNRDKKKVGHEDSESADVIHLNRMTFKAMAVSLAVGIAGIFGLAWLMDLVENPMSYLDASVAVLSAEYHSVKLTVGYILNSSALSEIAEGNLASVLLKNAAKIAHVGNSFVFSSRFLFIIYLRLLVA